MATVMPTGEVRDGPYYGRYMWPAKERFLALADLLLDYDKVMEYENLIAWPLTQDNVKKSPSRVPRGTTMRPTERMRRDWFQQVMEGTAEAKPEVKQKMAARLDQMRRLEQIQTTDMAMKAARAYSRKAIDGQLKTNELVAVKYFHDGAGFTHTSFKTNDAEPVRKIGRGRINAGPKPKRLPPGQTVPAVSVKVLDGSNSTS